MDKETYIYEIYISGDPVKVRGTRIQRGKDCFSVFDGDAKVAEFAINTVDGWVRRESSGGRRD